MKSSLAYKISPILQEGQVGKILEAGQAISTPRDYLPYLVNVVRRLEEGLRALESFEAMAAQWRAAAERELRAA